MSCLGKQDAGAWVEASFRDVDGCAFADLVLDDSHGLALRDKLFFMGVPEQTATILASEMVQLVGHGYVSGGAAATSNDASPKKRAMS